MARKSRWLAQETQTVTAPVSDAWVYARISNENEKSEDSIDNQIAICKAYISENTGLVFRDAFTDSGFSGTNFDRPGYADMMAGILTGDVRCVVVKDLSRLGRTYIEVGELLFDTFIEYGVRFISVNDRYDSDGEDASRKKLLILFKNLVNHMYSLDLGKKIRSSFFLKQKKGEVLGCLPPYGYTFTTEGGGKRLAVEPESAEIVRQIFDMRLHGYSTIRITEYLNRNGILPPGNHYYKLGLVRHEKHAKQTVWQNNYVCNLLVNEIYAGHLIQGKHERRGKSVRQKPREEWIIHENAHPAIVDRDVFDSVQILVAEAREKYKKHGNKLGENIYVGKVFCSRCGKAAKRGYYRKNKNEVKFNYFCRYCDDELKRDFTPDTIRRVPVEKVESVVASFIQKQMDICLDIDSLLEKITDSSAVARKRQALLTERQRCQSAKGKAGDLLAAAYTHHLQGLLDKREFELARAKFELDKQEAASGLARVERALADYDMSQIRKNECLTSFRDFKGFTRIDRAIVGALVERIEITPMSDNVDVTLAFADSFGKLNSLMEESGVRKNDC